MPYKRNRTHIEGTPVPFYESFRINNDPPVSLGPFPQYLVPNYKVFETFEDVVGARDSVNFAHHVSIRASLESPKEDFKEAHGWTYHSISGAPVMLDIRDSQLLGMVPDPSNVHAAEWAYEAYTGFTQQIPTEVSLANFMYELKDIKGLIPKIESSLSKTASSNFLAFSFGWKPMVGDIQKIFGLQESIQKRLKHLKATAGKPISLSFERAIPSPVQPADIHVQYGGSIEGPEYIIRRVSYQGKFRIFGKLVQNLNFPSLDETNARAFAAATGFNNPAAIAWEAVPYSFVVDWIFHVDSLIDTLNVQPFGGEWTVSKVGYSVKDEFLYNVYLKTPNADGNREIYIGNWSIRRYVRKPGFPMSSLLLVDGTLSPTQQVLAVALLEQKRR